MSGNGKTRPLEKQRSLKRSGSSKKGASSPKNGEAFPGEALAAKQQKDASRERYRSFRVRTISSLLLVGSFFTIIYWGHVPLMFMILGIQCLMVRELFALARVAQQDRKIPGFRAQQWYFFFVAAFWMYIRQAQEVLNVWQGCWAGRFIKNNLFVEITKGRKFIKNNLFVEITSSARLARVLGWLLRRHTMLSFSLYCAGLISFVLTLKKGMYTYQFGQYAWTHMILLVVFVPSSFFVSNLFEGIIWFLLPTGLVIINDIAAYLAGFFWGRTPLIKLSPKKTWEGFIGGFWGTVAASWLLAWIFSQWKWFTCPRTDLSVGWLDCENSDTFKPHTFRVTDLAEALPPAIVDGAAFLGSRLPPAVAAALENFSFTCLPMQLHAVALAVFASLAAPFGGFFASGFKRGFKIKDFGDSIPGHGGVTDRFDCQVVMAVFAYVYYSSYVAPAALSVGGVLSQVMKLNDRQKLELFQALGNVLAGESLLPQRLVNTIQDHVLRQRHR
ncbi:hypothetical protein N2152v2_008066 [Parachlorella kessleri]